MTEIQLEIDPRLIIDLMHENQRRRNVLLLDLDADRDQDASILDCYLNVVFNPRSIRRGKIRRYNYYVGSTGMRVILKAENGEVKNQTPPVTLKVKYTQRKLEKRKHTLSLTPKFEVKQGKAEAKAEIGSVVRDTEMELGYTSEFDWGDEILTPTAYGDSVLWTLQLPEGQKVVRDFLEGNLELRARCEWQGNIPHRGTVSIQPSDILFFNRKRHEVGLGKSALMLFILWTQGRSIEFWDGFEFSFQEIS